MAIEPPLSGIKVVEHASGVAAAYAGRLFTAMGAETVMVEPTAGSPLRREPPFFGTTPDQSALFAYLGAGKRSVALDLMLDAYRDALDALLADAHVLIDDTAMGDRVAIGLGADRIRRDHPDIVHVSVLPFGAAGDKAGWRGEEINLVHAGGEGFLLPNGLSADLFPDRPPVKIAGHFAEMQGGVAAVLGALSALWTGKGQFVDTSVQDANVAVGAFAIQRYGDGSLEHRHHRSFRYGGVIECSDGFVELLTLEERQWQALVKLIGEPAWAMDEALSDPAERSARGREINEAIRSWARRQQVAELVARAQALGVPMAPYNAPSDVLADPHVKARGLFAAVELADVGGVPMLTAPFRFGEAPLVIRSGPPELGADQDLLGAASKARQARRAEGR